MNQSLGEKNSYVSIKKLFVYGGAFAAYTIGSGFATGAEVLQFFGSWGHPWPIITVLISFTFLAYFASSVYKTGYEHKLTRQIDIFQYYFGNIGGRIVDIVVLIVILPFCTSMFAGCGATINQYFGVPVYVGAILLGIAASFVACLGLKRVVDTLGSLGVVIIAFVVFLGIYAAIVATQSFSEAQSNIGTYVEQGKVLQIGVLGFYNPIFSALNYVGVVVVTGFCFYTSLGSQMNSRREANIASVFSSGFFHLGMLLVLIAVLFNIDYIVEVGAQVPNLAVMQNILPALEPVFAVILILGIFTTITGYLWLISRRFAKDRTAKSRIIIIAIALIGIFGGSLIPFGTLVNIIYPYCGLVGMIMFIAVVIKEIKLKRSGPKEKVEVKEEVKEIEEEETK